DVLRRNGGREQRRKPRKHRVDPVAGERGDLQATFGHDRLDACRSAAPCRHRIVVHLGNVDYGLAAGLVERAAYDQRATGVSLHQQDVCPSCSKGASDCATFSWKFPPVTMMTMSAPSVDAFRSVAAISSGANPPFGPSTWMPLASRRSFRRESSMSCRRTLQPMSPSIATR